MRISIPAYSDQELTPRVMETVRAIVDSSFPEHDITFAQFDPAYYTKVLVFGRAPTRILTNIEFIYTYSLAQLVSKANAASVLTAGIRRFISEPEKIPFTNHRNTNLYVELEELDPNLPTAIDIETDGALGTEHTPEEVNILSVAFYQAGHPPIVITNTTTLSVSTKLATWQLVGLAKILPRFSKAIYHNGKFDIRVLNRVLGVELVNWFDTMLAHHVLNIAAGDHKLKTLARRYLGAPEWEENLSKYTKGGGHYENIPNGLLALYNSWDVYWTYKLWEFLAPQIEADENNETAFALEMQAAKFLLSVEQYGIPFDTDYSHKYQNELLDQLYKDQRALEDLTGYSEFNPNSPKQVKNFLLLMYGIDAKSTDEEYINLLKQEASIPSLILFCETLLSYRKLNKIISTYIIGWRNKSRNGRVHPTYLVHGTTTGRLSSTQPNAQNVPREKAIRKLVATHESL